MKIRGAALFLMGCLILTIAGYGNVLAASSKIPVDNLAYEPPSEGLSFELNADGESYSCTGLASCRDKRAVIPSEFDGKPVTGLYRTGDLSWVNYVTTEVVIPDSVTSIADETFKYCVDMTAIYIPDSVTSIGKDAFLGCGKLTIFCVAESEAHRYALEQGIACETIAPTQSSSPYPYEEDGSSIKTYSIEELCALAKKYCQTKYGVTPPYADGYPQAGTVTIQLYSIVRDEHTATMDWLYVDYHGRGTNMFGESVDLSEFDDAPKEYILYCDGKQYQCEHDLEYYISATKSTEYSPELASVLMGLAYAAYDKNDIIKSSASLLGVSEEACFTDNYPISKNQDSVAYSIAIKESENGEKIALVVARGTTGDREGWSNINIGASGYGYAWHLGFSTAAKEVYDNLKVQLGGIPISGIKYVFTGHSRGAAVANLLELMLSNDGVPKENVYGYNFACPDVAVASPLGVDWNPFGAHDNMFNIANATDPVAVVPGAVIGSMTIGGTIGDWGKFGRSYWFSENWNDPSKVNLVRWFDTHGQDIYFANMRNFAEKNIGLESFKSWFELQRHRAVLNSGLAPLTVLGIFCPVDVKITDMAGTTLLTITDGYISLADQDVSISAYVFDGDKKLIILDGQDDYHVLLSATAAGEMSLDLAEFDPVSFEAANEVVFSDVPLTEGKMMSLDIGEGQDSAGVQLFAIDTEGKKISEIYTDGTEASLQEEKTVPLRVVVIGCAAAMIIAVLIILVLLVGRRKNR